MKKLILFLIAAAAFAQTQETRVANTPVRSPSSLLVAYDASNNPLYIGWPTQIQTLTRFTVTSLSAAAAAVATITAHGLQTGNSVVVAGGTGDWTGVNGTHYITRTAASTFTIPINSSGYAGSFAGTITSTAPRSSTAIWMIQKNTFDASNNLTLTQWANCNPNCIWDNRATTSGATMVTWR